MECELCLPKQGSRRAVFPAGHRGQQEQGKVTTWFDPDPEFERGGSQEQRKGQPDPLPLQGYLSAATQVDSEAQGAGLPYRIGAS